MGRRQVSVVCSTALESDLLSYHDILSGGSIIVKQIGHAILTVDLPGGKTENLLITLPKLRIDGLWYGSPYIELVENSWIQSSTGWLSSVSRCEVSHTFIRIN